MKAVRLRTEYLTEPIGLGIRYPRFFWNCEGGIKQTAYQIIAKRGAEIVWDSGKVNSDEMTHIRYQGKELSSRDIISWTVCLWDEEGKAGEITESSFEMGLLEPDDWNAKWICENFYSRFLCNIYKLLVYSGRITYRCIKLKKFDCEILLMRCYASPQTRA